MISPFRGNVKVTSPYGYRNDPFTGKRSFHKGIDLVGLNNTDVHAIGDGKVDVCYEEKGFGIYVKQYLENGITIYYAHLETTCVKSGDYITPNTKIGFMGTTGNSTGKHTHLEFRYTGNNTTSLPPEKFTYIPNVKGTITTSPEMTPYFAGCVVEDKCGIDKSTMFDLWEVEYADKTMIKLAYKLLNLK